MKSVTLTFGETRLPDSVDVDSIAEVALQSAFGSIADEYAKAGYPITGDVDPLEAHLLDEVFRGFVRLMGINNDQIAAADERYWDEIVTLEIEAVEPGELISHPSGVWVRRETRGSSAGDLVTLRGSRAEVRRFVADNWDESELYRVDAARAE